MSPAGPFELKRRRNGRQPSPLHDSRVALPALPPALVTVTKPLGRSGRRIAWSPRANQVSSGCRGRLHATRAGGLPSTTYLRNDRLGNLYRP
jgi:hypothetical protein